MNNRIDPNGKLLWLWNTKNFEAAYAKKDSIYVWPLAWSGCSSPSTEELHAHTGHKQCHDKCSDHCWHLFKSVDALSWLCSYSKLRSVMENYFQLLICFLLLSSFQISFQNGQSYSTVFPGGLYSRAKQHRCYLNQELMLLRNFFGGNLDFPKNTKSKKCLFWCLNLYKMAKQCYF